jgi:outer membrane murein-binding lipoprotein Lpp
MCVMNDAQVTRAATRLAARVHRFLADDIDRLRRDAGAAGAELARTARVDPGFLHRILNGVEHPS